MERAPWRVFAAIFKKKNVVGEKASRSAHEMREKWEIVARKPVFAAVSRTHDMHRLALLIRAWARSFFLKASYPVQCIPAPVQCIPANAWMTQIRTRTRVCQRTMKTPARLLTGHGKSRKANVCGNF